MTFDFREQAPTTRVRVWRPAGSENLRVQRLQLRHLVVPVELPGFAAESEPSELEASRSYICAERFCKTWEWNTAYAEGAVIHETLIV